VRDLRINEMEFYHQFLRTCDDGWRHGWHEANGGNLSYRLTFEEITAIAPEFSYERPWTTLGCEDAQLTGSFLLVTGAGQQFRDVSNDPNHALGIIEIDTSGSAWRIVWGLEDGGRPTSELTAHYLDYCACSRAKDRARHVIYHAHTPQLVAMSLLVSPDSRMVSRLLWKSMTECIMVIPAGVGVVPWTMPGSFELADHTAKLMETFDAVLWAQHGMVVAGLDFSTAFGLMHTLEKTASIYLSARAAYAGSSDLPEYISDENLRVICARLGLSVNEAFL
jgi:rhamnulose-1-phosphate aldolase